VRHPSGDGDLNLFGRHFAQFLDSFPHVASYPHFPDLARLEWALHRALHGADAPGISAAELAALSAAEFETLPLTLHPACHLLQSEWPTLALWQAHQIDGAPLPLMVRAPGWALVVRPLWQPRVLALTEAGHAALSALERGKHFGAALDAAFDVDPDFDVASHLQQWIAQAVLVWPVR
jgi:hypothetical protein